MNVKEKQEQQFLAMLHGKATDTLASIHSGDINEDAITHSIEAVKNDVVVKTKKELPRLSTHKLLSAAIIVFCSQNVTGSEDRKIQSYKVTIPLRKYAFLCGYSLSENGPRTKTDRNSMKEIRRKVKRDLDSLFALEMTWTESLRGKSFSYMRLRVISEQGLVNGNIVITFSQSFAEYLIRLPLTRYSLALLKVDERNPNAYAIGLHMSEHYFIRNNSKARTAQSLKVRTLLKQTGLPDRNSASVKRSGWRERIKKPFESSLDSLIRCGLLKDWKYKKSKENSFIAAEEEPHEADVTFEQWTDMIIFFTLRDAPDQAEGLEDQNHE